MGNKFVTPQQMIQGISDGSTVATVGMTLISASETILKEIERSFLETGHPQNLTLVHSAGQSDRKRGIQHFAHEGLVTKLIGSHWGLQPRWMDMIANNKVKCYCLPQGQVTHLYRAMACGLPGAMSKVGLGTFVDPRIEGGKMNEITKELPDISEIMNYDGEEYMFYKKIPIDYCIIRGTTADENGNITTTEEAMKLEVLPAVLATKRFGGKVLVQVKNVAQAGTLNPKEITVPGVFVDQIVVCEDPFEDHRQTSSWYYDPSYCGALRVPESSMEPLKMDIRKFIGRRAICELKPGDIINLGTGIPNDVVGKIAQEEGVMKDITITVESGIYGGIQAGGIDFGIGQNLEAMITHHEQMDFYDGTGVDVAFLGAGELDEEGNVNSTKMGPRCSGAGGLLDITESAKKIMFCSTFTAKDLDVSFDNGKVAINHEGKIRKLVKRVNQISLNGNLARKKGQEVYFVTERALFKLVKEGVMLMEIAPGIDLQKDVLDQMDFKPIISENIKLMDDKLFLYGKFGLKEIINKK